ncbi:DUF1778 domain-containing protein [Phenylobacterium sp.]|uniref:type II toxin-antitoxin system TacA family antitoxin n=1 Tax=Phenylobacterium sp. TaxID=1871053 RepID=UPI00273653C2|nr:DUF1778 domain-containing protein [Phenylobacterium sp.]MDP3854375.1 DUF1778 domain-containing protein [Phenylobacterium sp.]
MATTARERQDATHGVTLNIRADPRRRDLIDRAAEALGKSRSEFMLETACKEAESVLLDRRYFTLDEAQFQAFLARLDAPAPSAKLVELLNTKAPWEK